MFEDIINKINEIEKNNNIFQNSIKKLAKEDLVFLAGDTRYSNKIIFKTFVSFKDHKEEIKKDIEDTVGYFEYAPWGLPKTEALLQKTKVTKAWKNIPNQEIPEIILFCRRINFVQLGYEELLNFSRYNSYNPEETATTIRLKKYNNKLMMLLFNKNGTFNIFQIKEAQNTQNNDGVVEQTSEEGADIKGYDSGIYSKFYPLNTALFIEGMLNTDDSVFKEKIKKIVEENPSSTFSNIYNFVNNQKEKLEERIDRYFESMNLILSGKYFAKNEKIGLKEIKNKAIKYINPYDEGGRTKKTSFTFKIRTNYRRDLAETYLLLENSKNGIELEKEKRTIVDNKQEQIYYSMFPQYIRLDVNLGLGVKFNEFEKKYLFSEKELYDYCKINKNTQAYTTGMLNMYRNIQKAINEKITAADHLLSEVANLYEYESMFVKTCRKIDELNVEPMKTNYLLGSL